MDVFNVTATPSGNVSFQDHVRLEFTLDEPGLDFTNVQRGNFHALSMDGLLQELNSNVRGSYVLDFGDGFTIECTYAQKYHEANGEIQYDTTEFECS
jgi:hypothetical protein